MRRKPEPPLMSNGIARKRYFTTDEANAYLPFMEETLGQMRAFRRRMEALTEEMGPVFENIASNTGGRIAAEFAATLFRFQRLATRIEDEGILLRDVESGLADFPALRSEREVYLCWTTGEPEVCHWHEVDAGFSGRKRLGELDENDLRNDDGDEV
ncbi:MAG: DUF2203 domain-containing protein [Candidatus Poribacteria bacterium]|nr:DUF2203 domain-containing protein [Candidatus Poribacteria bacterium]